MAEVMELNLEDCDYVLKGHNLKDEEIIEAIKKHFNDDIKIISKYETWGHWCYGTWEGESKIRYFIFYTKYKGVRGGFPITVIEDSEIKHSGQG